MIDYERLHAEVLDAMSNPRQEILDGFVAEFGDADIKDIFARFAGVSADIAVLAMREMREHNPQLAQLIAVFVSLSASPLANMIDRLQDEDIKSEAAQLAIEQFAHLVSGGKVYETSVSMKKPN